MSNQSKGQSFQSGAGDPPRPPFPPQHQTKPGLEAEMEPRPKFEAPHYMPAGKLEGKVALITGGDSGIGRAVAHMFAREGADVAIAYLPEEQKDADITAQRVRETGRACLQLPGDLAKDGECEAMVGRVMDHFGRIDVLIHNAAHQNRKPSILEITDEEWDKTFRVNAYAYFRLIKAALPRLPRGGSIIATGSIVGLRGSSHLADYAATKGAIDALTKSLAPQLIERGVRINVVAPGPVWTPLNVADAGTSKDEVSKQGEKVPYGRPAQPEEIAPAFVFLASEADSSYITGTVIVELGGETVGA